MTTLPLVSERQNTEGRGTESPARAFGPPSLQTLERAKLRKKIFGHSIAAFAIGKLDPYKTIEPFIIKEKRCNSQGKDFNENFTMTRSLDAKYVPSVFCPSMLDYSLSDQRKSEEKIPPEIKKKVQEMMQKYD